MAWKFRETNTRRTKKFRKSVLIYSFLNKVGKIDGYCQNARSMFKDILRFIFFNHNWETFLSWYKILSMLEIKSEVKFQKIQDVIRKNN